MTKLKLALNIFYWVVFGFLVVIAIGVVFARGDNFNSPIKLFSVETGSMSPSIPRGSIVVVRQMAEYGPGDVVTFRSLADPSQTTTHRIVEGGELYKTRGDANEEADPGGISFSQIVGKVVFHLPLIGYLVSIAKTREGFVFLIVAPAAAIVVMELNTIKNEVVRLANRRN